jgi:hypothetical protein
VWCREVRDLRRHDGARGRQRLGGRGIARGGAGSSPEARKARPRAEANSKPGIERRRRRVRRTAHLWRLRRSGRSADGGKGAGGGTVHVNGAAQERKGRGEAMSHVEEEKRTNRYVV